jgi:hypothetical protein
MASPPLFPPRAERDQHLQWKLVQGRDRRVLIRQPSGFPPHQYQGVHPGGCRLRKCSPEQPVAQSDFVARFSAASQLLVLQTTGSA